MSTGMYQFMLRTVCCPRHICHTRHSGIKLQSPLQVRLRISVNEVENAKTCGPTGHRIQFLRLDGVTLHTEHNTLRILVVAVVLVVVVTVVAAAAAAAVVATKLRKYCVLFNLN